MGDVWLENSPNRCQLSDLKAARRKSLAPPAVLTLLCHQWSPTRRAIRKQWHRIGLLFFELFVAAWRVTVLHRVDRVTSSYSSSRRCRLQWKCDRRPRSEGTRRSTRKGEICTRAHIALRWRGDLPRGGNGNQALATLPSVLIIYNLTLLASWLTITLWQLGERLRRYSE